MDLDKLFRKNSFETFPPVPPGWDKAREIASFRGIYNPLFDDPNEVEILSRDEYDRRLYKAFAS